MPYDTHEFACMINTTAITIYTYLLCESENYPTLRNKSKVDLTYNFICDDEIIFCLNNYMVLFCVSENFVTLQSKRMFCNEDNK